MGIAEIIAVPLQLGRTTMPIHKDVTSDWLGLSGRVCIVTGAGGGIGRATALSLARAGAAVALLDRDWKTMEESLAEVKAIGVPAMAIACDVSDPDSVADAASSSLSTLGPCDVLVNNAGLLRSGAIETLSAADWQITMGVNLNGCLFCSQSFGRQMLQRQRGAIVHIASIAGGHAQGFSGAYSVSKAGVIMLSRQIATEWGPRGIRSNVVSPGMIRTPMSESFYAHQDVLERRSRMVPVGRVGQPEDIANAVTYLASDRASYVSGEEVVVDGAYTRTIMDLAPRPGFEKPGS